MHVPQTKSPVAQQVAPTKSSVAQQVARLRSKAFITPGHHSLGHLGHSTSVVLSRERVCFLPCSRKYVLCIVAAPPGGPL